MILHLGDDVSVHSADIIAIIDLTQSYSTVTGAMLTEIRRQNRVLAKRGVTAKSAVICAGARKAGGVAENARVYLSPISAVTLAQRAHERGYLGLASVRPHADAHPDADAQQGIESGKTRGTNGQSASQ